MKDKLLFRKLIASFAGFAILLSVVAPIHASESSYEVITKTLYAVENGVEVSRQIDYVKNPNGGPTLGLLHNEAGVNGENQYILEVEENGYTYAFKDMDKDGVLSPYEDWRLDTETRAKDLANTLASTDEGIKKIAGLMLFSSHEGDSASGLTNDQIAYLDGSYVRNITDAAGNNVTDAVGWSNAMQAHVEESDFNIPVNFSSDPRSTAGSGDLYSPEASDSGISAWPSNLGLAATFSNQDMYNFAKASSAEYRAMGIVTALGPQIDLATDPRWLRNGGTFGENVELTSDMTQAYVNGSQSTFGDNGKDLGWGRDSIVTMIKHFPGDGAGEGGRESHTESGKYAVYPGSNFDEHLIPFKRGLASGGSTTGAGAVMTSYSIGINADGTPFGGENDRKGSAYNLAKMAIIRDDLGYDGVICTDWGVTEAGGAFGMAWGAEHLTNAERHYEILKGGTDMFGGNNEGQPIVDAFGMFVNDFGEQFARERFAASAKRLIKLTMEPGLFENAYLDHDESLAIAGSADKLASGYQTQLNSVVMLKNANETIVPATNVKKDPSEMTVYIPMTYSEKEDGIFGSTPAKWFESISVETARGIYGTVITDELQTDGTYKTPDLSNVDMVIAGMRTPNNGGLFSNTGMTKHDDGTTSFYPLSLQYRPYTADSEFVRQTSIAGDILVDGTQQNRSYYGNTSKISNEYDLTAVLNAVEAVEVTGKDIPVVVAMNANGPAIVSEFEDVVDSIIVGFSVSDQALFDIINGKHEPNGLLPMQFPRDMETVEKQLEDVGQDLIPYKDTQGNTYDFAYGLNWNGIIDDERVAKYNPSRPTTDKGTLALEVRDFTLTYEEAKTATEEVILEKANPQVTHTAMERMTPEITFDKTVLETLHNIDVKGGTVEVAITAKVNDLTETKISTIIVDKKVEDKTKPVDPEQDKDKDTNTTPTTGIQSNMMLLISVFAVAMSYVGFTLFKKYRKH